MYVSLREVRLVEFTADRGTYTLTTVSLVRPRSPQETKHENCAMCACRCTITAVNHRKGPIRANGGWRVSRSDPLTQIMCQARPTNQMCACKRACFRAEQHSGKESGAIKPARLERCWPATHEVDRWSRREESNAHSTSKLDA